MDKLPEEILCQIFRDLHISQLVRVAPTCKRFARVAESLIYACCPLSSLDDPGHQLRMLQPLLRTLVGCPNLGRLVREIDLGEWYSYDPSLNGPLEKDKLALVSPRACHDFIRRSPTLTGCSTDFQSDLESGLQDTTQDALTAAILSFLPNLRSLSLEMDCYEWNEETASFGFVENEVNDHERMLTFRLIEFAAMAEPVDRSPFRHLSSVNLHTGTLDWDTRIVSFFLRLPSMKKFVGLGCGDTYKDRTWACDDAASNVTHLELHSCEIDIVSVKRLLRSCRTLQTFICHRFHTPDEPDGNIPGDYFTFWADIYRDLLRHRESLHRLHLQSECLSDTGPSGNEPARLVSLAAFEALEELEVDESALYGCYDYSTRHLSQFLPPNIKRLTIAGRTEFYLKQLLIEMRDALMSKPNLRTIKFKSADITKCDLGFLIRLPAVGTQMTLRRETFYIHRRDILTMSKIDGQEIR